MERNPDGTPKGWPCCDRAFPDPDPLYRYVHPDDIPPFFWEMPPVERSRRLRCYLVCIAAGEHSFLSWQAALNFEAKTIAQVHELVDVINRDDTKIERMLAERARINRMLKMEPVNA